MPQTTIQHLVPNLRLVSTKRMVGALFNRGSHHPGTGVGPPSRATARPSSAEEGTPKTAYSHCFNLLGIFDEQHFIAPFVVDQFVDDLLGD
jgi:hypothetical protein